MRCVIVDYGSGNVRSVLRALEQVSVRHTVTLSDNPKIIAQADHLVLPGVGAFAHCAQSLKARPGVLEALYQQVIERNRPFLGVCVGMQLLASYGEEYDGHEGLDWIAGRVQPFDPEATKGRVIPHMGWSPLVTARRHPVLKSLPASGMMYFVHSYVFRPSNPANILAWTDYGERYPALVGRDNLIGTQFHPEKSQKMGLELLRNFLNWKP